MAKRGGNTADLRPTLMDHIKELRNRGMIVALTLIVGSVLAYSFKDQLFNVLLDPLEGQQLISLTPGGSLQFIMNLSIFSGFAFATPFLIYHLYGFLKPMMPEKMRRNSVTMFLFSMTLLAGGIAFAYFLALPGALRFLFEFSDGFIQMSQLSADSYLTFFVQYLIGLGLIFQTPLVLLFIHWVHPLTPKGLMKSERWVIVMSFIVGAIITPTQDPVNLMIVALPTIAVYQIGVFIIINGIFRQRRRGRRLLAKTKKRELAAVKHAVAERKKLNTAAPARPISVAAAAPAAALKPVQKVSVQQDAVPIMPAPFAKKGTVDGFLPQPRITAPSLAVVHRAPAASVPRPAERPAQMAQTYRTRTSIDGFARRPALIVTKPATPVTLKPVQPTPMQTMVNRQSISGFSRGSIDGISAAMTA